MVSQIGYTKVSIVQGSINGLESDFLEVGPLFLSRVGFVCYYLFPNDDDTQGETYERYPKSWRFSCQYEGSVRQTKVRLRSH